jgi:hypothetical protein
MGAIWALYTYLEQQKTHQQELERQTAKEAVTRRLEAQKPFLNKQLELYFETSQIAGNWR